MEVARHPKPASPRPAILLKVDELAEQSIDISHPWSDRSKRKGDRLSRELGMMRTGVGLLTIPPGQESFARHLHHHDDAWIATLSGRRVAVLGAREIGVGPGDFSAMPAPQEPLTLRNLFNLDLTDRSGGISAPFDVVDLPAVGKPMMRMTTRPEMVPLSAVAPMDWTKRDPD